MGSNLHCDLLVRSRQAGSLRIGQQPQRPAPTDERLLLYSRQGSGDAHAVMRILLCHRQLLLLCPRWQCCVMRGLCAAVGRGRLQVSKQATQSGVEEQPRQRDAGLQRRNEG